MQLDSRSGSSPLKRIILGSMWVLGLLLAGSDGDYMPWLNLAGLLLFGGAAACMAGFLPAAAKRRKPFNRPKLFPGAPGGIRRRRIHATGPFA